jgi:hypothetical protein
VRLAHMQDAAEELSDSTGGSHGVAARRNRRRAGTVKLRRAPKDPPRPSSAEAGHPHAPDSEMEEGQAALRDVGAGGNLRRPDGLKRGPPPTPRPRVTRSTSASMAGQDPATGKVIGFPFHPIRVPMRPSCSCKQISDVSRCLA